MCTLERKRVASVFTCVSQAFAETSEELGEVNEWLAETKQVVT